MKKLYWLALLLAVAILIISAVKLFGYFSQSWKSDQITDTMLQSGSGGPAEGEATQTSGSYEVRTSPLQVDFDTLQKQYPDLAAWIYSPDTPINYPVMYSGDNDYYLRRLPDGTANQNGSLFLDYRNAIDFSDLNCIIYGHNMKNSDMFGSLENYREQSYFEKHPVMYILTPDANYEMRLLGGYDTPPDSSAYDIPTSLEERDQLADMALRASVFESGYEPDGEGALVTLSTCTYGAANDRFIIVGYLIEIE